MKEKSNDNFIDHLSDEDFKKWIIEPTYERDLFWNTWLEKNPDKKEQVKAAKEYILSAHYREHQISESEEDEILGNIIMNTPSKRKLLSKRKRNNLISSVYKVAAAVLLLMTFSALIWWNTQSRVNEQQVVSIKKENLKGQKSSMKLPDGTMVTLNSESILYYDSNYGEHDRTVRITGEAFFEVKQDIHKPFNVISGDIKTTALGTSFNVSAFEDERSLKVSLLTGKVKVVNMNDETSYEDNILFPGEGFIIKKENGQIEKVNVDPLLDYGWKEGILVFRDNDLSYVIKSLERWYGVNISVMGQPNKKWRVDGEFDNITLEQLLKSLSYTYDLEFIIHGKDVELKFN